MFWPSPTCWYGPHAYLRKGIKICMFPLISHSSAFLSQAFQHLHRSRASFLQSSYSSVTMRTTLCIAALAGVAYSAPQLINLDEIAADFAPPVLVKAPVNVVSNIPASSTPDAVIPLQSASAKKRDLKVEKRDGDCSPYPAGSGPVPTPDTPDAFQSDPDFAVRLCYRERLLE